MSTVYPQGTHIERRADLSHDGVFRYTLHRWWGLGERLMFIMLNPSTADADLDDPTIRRCVGFARTHGYDGVSVFNLYAYRATNPADLWNDNDPWRPADITGGKRNDDLLREVLRHAHRGCVVAAWGSHARPSRVREVLGWEGAEHLRALGTTQRGAPRHPLYLPANAPLLPWPAPEGPA